MGRRVLAFLLSMALTASMVPVSTFGAEILPEETAAVTMETGASTAETTAATVQNTLPTEAIVTETAAAATEETEFSANAEAEAGSMDLIASGSCGSNLRWELYSNGLLSIFGSGAMNSYQSTSAPWANYAERITSVIVYAGSIGYGAFRGLEQLEEADLDVSTIGTAAFDGCTSLKRVECSGVTAMELGAFSFCSSLESFEIPSGVPTVPQAAFLACTSLQSITIPNTVKTIEFGAFNGCAMEWLVIPGSVTKLANAFANNRNLKGVYFEGDMPEATNGGYGLTTTIYYPATNKTWTASAMESMSGTFVATGCSSYNGSHTLHESAYIQPGCTEVGYTEGVICNCGFELIPREEIPAVGHSSVTDPAVANSCTKDGYTEGSHCPNCGEVFLAQEVIPATGHTVVEDKGYANSCRENGLSDGSHCSVCQEVLEAQTVIPAAHRAVTDEAVPNTCTEDGLTEGSHCSVCQEILVAQKVIPAAHTEAADPAVEATCTETGLTEGKHCSACGEVLVAQEIVKAKGHREVADEAVAPTCTQTGLTEGSHCSVCQVILVKQETVQAKGHTEVTDQAAAPTCTETGLTEGSHCSVCGAVLTAQKTVAALGHDMGQWEEETSPDCTRSGIQCRQCGRCDYIEMEELEALGHDWGQWQTTKEAGCTEDGEKVRTCGRCADTETQSIPAGHTLVNGQCSICGVYSGTFSGGRMTWVLDDEGVLTISGSGSMEDYAFASGIYTPWWNYQNAILSVVIGNGVTTIGDEAFRACGNLKHISIPNDVEAIGYGAFWGCSSLTDVELPYALTYLGARAFYNCSSLKDIAIPYNLRLINGETFAGCSRLESFYFQYHWQTPGYIQSNAFLYCYNLKDIYYSGSKAQWMEILPTRPLADRMHFDSTPWNHWKKVAAESADATCTEAGYLYESCSCGYQRGRTAEALGHDWGQWVIDREAVCTENGEQHRTCGRCGLGTTEQIPATGHSEVVDEARDATCADTGLTQGSHCETCGEILVPQEVTAMLPHRMQGNVCRDCGWEMTVDWEISAEGVLTVSGEGTLTDFSSAWDTPWYDRRYEITALVVEEGVTEIGSYAFANLNSLRSVVLPDSVQTIGSFAFSGCDNLKELSFPASAWVEEGAFESCSALRRITVTPGTGDMRDYDKETSQYLPWQYGSGYVIFSEGVRSIGAYAFYDVRRIEQVFLPDSLRSIGRASFGYNSIPRIQVPEGVTTLGDFAFSEAVALETITLPGSIRSWGKTLFAGSGLVTAQLPEGMTQIPEEMFHTCEKLEIVNIPGTVREIGTEAFCNCPELWDVTLPEGVRIIGEHAFSYSGISHITFPDSLEYISDYAFYACDAMRTVTLPKNTRRVGVMAFAHSDKIHSVVINTMSLVVDSGAFKNCYSLDSVYFCGGPGLWDVGYVPQEGEFGVHLNTSDYLTSAEMHYNNDYVPVDRINIKDSGGKFGKVGSVLNGRTIYVDINKVKSFSLSFETLPKNASRAETTVLLRDFGNTAPAAIKVTGKTIALSQLKCGEATVFVQNYSPKTVAQLGYNPYTYATATVRFVFYSPVTGISIFGDDQGYLPMNETRTLRAEVTPANAEVMGVLWSVENGTGAGIIDEYGRFTGTRAGTVTIRAAAVDGSGVVAEKTVTVYDEYSVAISGPGTVAAGKTITLKAAFVPFNITGTKILWRLKDPADGAYVALSGGKVTAKKVDQQRVVTVVAETADGKARSAEHTVLVVPVTASVAVTVNGEAAAGGTAVWDLKDPDQEPLVFEARTWPEDAGDEIIWTVSDKTGAFGQYRIEGNALTVMNPTGKTGTVTLTAAAADGSGKKSTVKLQFARLAQTVEILEAPQELRGGSKVNLKTNVALDKTLTDKNLVWSLSEDSVPYASVSAQGVLTTRAVQEPVEITVIAGLKANPQRRSEIRIRLVPSASEVRIGVNGQWKQKNETVYVDLANPTVTLQSAILPENALAEGSWKLSSTAMARMENGEDGTVSVTLQKAGTVTVTFTADDGSKKNTAVKLQGVLLTRSIGLHAPKGETELRSGKTLQLKTAPGTAQPGVAPTIKKYSWSVSDPTVASVSATGSVKALPVAKNTPVTVTAEALDGSGVRESYTLLIKPAAEQTLVIRRNGTEDITGDTRFLGAVFDGVSAVPQERLSAWVYDSEADTYTQVDATFTAAGKVLYLAPGDGEWVVSPMAYGNAALTVKYGKLAAKVNYKSVRFVEGITVSSKTGADWVLAGKTLNLAAVVSNKDATVKKLAWSVDDPGAASVSAAGVVKAGAVTKRTTVTVTAAATDGSGVCGRFTLTVYPAATGIRIREKDTGRVMNNRTVTVSLDRQKTMTLESLVYPAGEEGALEKVVYACTGQGARIDGEGKITFLKKGTVTIKVTAADGSRISASFKIVIQ